MVLAATTNPPRAGRVMAASAGAKPAGSATAEPDAGGVFGRLSELAWQALPAIGSAIGFAGFVAVIGAAIEWIRFDAAKLPATQAVLAVPHAELVFVGALSLGVFVGGAVLAVLLVYLIDNNGNATIGTVRGIVGVGVVEMLVTLCFIDSAPWWTYVWLVAWVLLIGVVAADLAGEVMRNIRSRAKLKRARAKVVEARNVLNAAHVTRDTAGAVFASKPKRKNSIAQEQAQLALVSAQREWERSVREWEGAAKELDFGLSDEAKAEIARVGDVLSGYGDSPPDGDGLDSELAKAEKDTGHVFRAVRGRLREQASDLWKWFEPNAAKAIDRLKAVTKTPSFLDAGKRRDARAAAKAQTGRTSPEKAVKPAAAGSTAQGQDTVTAAAGKGGGVVFTGLLLLAAIVAGTVFVIAEDLFSWFALVFVVVVGLTTMNVFVARATEKFAWYGIAMFFSVLVFGATMTIAKTLDQPKAQPIALVRKGEPVGICGVFVAQTTERVYVGRRASEGRPGVIFWVPRSDVDLVSVGQPERTGNRFKTLAVAMLEQLYKDRAEAAGAALKNTTIVEEGVDSKTGIKKTETREEPPTPAETPKVGAETSSLPNAGYPQETPGKTCTEPSTAKQR